MNIYLSEVGGAGAISALKSLSNIKDEYDLHIVTSDMNRLAAGQHFSDEFIISPKVDETYLTFLDNLIQDKKIDLIIPTGEHDLQILAQHKHRWNNTKIFISSLEAIKVCQDKKLFYDTLRPSFSQYIPYVVLTNSLYKKPRTGAGSRGCERIEFDNDCLILEYLPGTEYTVDVFCNESSDSMGTVVRQRIETKAGISTQSAVLSAKTPLGNDLANTSEKICKYLKIVGPCCIQYKLDVNGNPKLLELNPRVGGASIVSTLAGINFAELYLELYHGRVSEKKTPTEITVTRYLNEIVL
jgi:carbamoyl-phosphate synthase large subunit